MRINSILTVFILIFLIFMAGCRESAQPTPDPGDVRMNLTIEPSPATVGEAVLLIIVTDTSGQVIEVQEISVRGDMTHAGMIPVLSETVTRTDNGYRIPFQWTMAGDWILTIEATLMDGRVVREEVEVSVER